MAQEGDNISAQPAFLGDLAGGLLGEGIGFLADKYWKKKEWHRQDTQLERMVADAQRAGLSPLAALGSSAAGQYAQPVPGQGGAGGHAADAVRRAFGNKMERLQLERAQKENDLLDAQIAAMNSETVNRATAARGVSEAQVMAGAAENRDQLDLFLEDPHTFFRIRYPNAAHQIGPEELLTMWYLRRQGEVREINKIKRHIVPDPIKTTPLPATDAPVVGPGMYGKRYGPRAYYP